MNGMTILTSWFNCYGLPSAADLTRFQRPLWHTQSVAALQPSGATWQEPDAESAVGAVSGNRPRNADTLKEGMNGFELEL